MSDKLRKTKVRWVGLNCIESVRSYPWPAIEPPRYSGSIPLIIQSRKYLIHRVGFEGLFTRSNLEFINDWAYITVTYFLKRRVMLNKLRRFQCGELDAGDFNAWKSCKDFNVLISQCIAVIIHIYWFASRFFTCINEIKLVFKNTN